MELNEREVLWDGKSLAERELLWNGKSLAERRLLYNDSVPPTTKRFVTQNGDVFRTADMRLFTTRR